MSALASVDLHEAAFVGRARARKVPWPHIAQQLGRSEITLRQRYADDVRRTDPVAILEAQVVRLQDKIIVLEAALGFDFLTPAHWKFTGQQTRLFGCLMARELMTTDAAMAALYGDRWGAEEAEEKIIDVHICRMRAKLKRYGLSIETRWGQGYYLTAAMKDRARQLLKVAA